jgi:hypothetical protein
MSEHMCKFIRFYECESCRPVCRYKSWDQLIPIRRVAQNIYMNISFRIMSNCELEQTVDIVQVRKHVS